MKKEDKAIQRVKDLIEKGKSKGVLTYKEIMDMLEEIDLEAEQIEKIYDTLETLGIDVVEEEDDVKDEDVVEDEDDASLLEGVSIDDP